MPDLEMGRNKQRRRKRVKQVRTGKRMIYEVKGRERIIEDQRR